METGKGRGEPKEKQSEPWHANVGQSQGLSEGAHSAGSDAQGPAGTRPDPQAGRGDRAWGPALAKINTCSKRGNLLTLHSASGELCPVPPQHLSSLSLSPGQLPGCLALGRGAGLFHSAPHTEMSQTDPKWFFSLPLSVKRGTCRLQPGSRY